MSDGIDGAIERCLSELGCPQCGARLRLLRVLSRRSATAVIATRCDGCGAVANRVCFTGDLLRQLHRRLSDDDTPATAEPVNAGDVTAMRDFLRTFDGDFRKLFGSAERQ